MPLRPLGIALPLLALLGVLGVVVAGGHTPAAAPGLTAEQEFTREEERFRSLSDYECVAEAESRAGSKSESGAYHLWYRSPGLLRVHVDRGRSSGSDVLVDARGRITARKGGLLRPFTAHLSP